MSIQDKIQTNYPLKDLTTFKIGGSAEYFIEVNTKEEVDQIWAFAKANNIVVTILGGGSNVLINDQGVKGLVVKINNHNLLVNGTEIIAGAGIKTWDVAQAAVDHDLTGLEWAIGIPGALGGAVRGNAGAHGGSFDKVISKVVAFDSKKGEWLEFSKDKAHFTYRQSLFKEEPHFIIWEISLDLLAGEEDMIRQAIGEYKKYRQELQPKEPSAGCIFKNFFFEDIKKANPSLAQQLEEANKVRGGKVGAGYLIELMGLKGFAVGGAKISEQHANFIVNFKEATCEDVLTIIKEVKTKAKNELNVDFVEEVQYL